jgi:DNA/RNA endonuclease G (NUC1)
MKKCLSDKCENLVKNSYTHCYDCNKKDDSDVETIYKKEIIPKCVRNCLWINYFGDSRIGKCQMCKREDISISSFQAGHIIAEANGGKTTLDNLKPVCQLCNTSSGKNNMDDFIKKYNLHFGLE